MVKQRRSSKPNHHKSSKAYPIERRKRKLEIKFDPDARREYLTGFSDRKRKRRTFGLAMQKVKDRKAKIEERKDSRLANQERFEDAERAKRMTLEGEDEGSDDDDGVSSEHNMEGEEEGISATITTHCDKATMSQFGSDVIVTTTYEIPSDSDDDEQQLPRDSGNGKRIDHEQLYAGSVHRFMSELKGNLPSKKKNRGSGNRQNRRKGRHGASDMKGMGGAANLKGAAKALAVVRAKQGDPGFGGRKKGGKKKGAR